MESKKESIPVPKNLLEAFMRYNILYPQMHIGVIGALWHEFLLAQSPLEELDRMSLSTEQIDAIANRMHVAHSANNLNVEVDKQRIEDLFLAFRRAMRQLFGNFVFAHNEIESDMPINYFSYTTHYAKNSRNDFVRYITLLKEVLDSDTVRQLAKQRNLALKHKKLTDREELAKEIVMRWQERCQQDIPDSARISWWFNFVKTLG